MCVDAAHNARRIGCGNKQKKAKGRSPRKSKVR